MKKFFLAAAMCAIAASGIAQTDGYKISVKVNDASLDGKMVYLKKYSQVVDSAKVENAAFGLRLA